MMPIVVFVFLSTHTNLMKKKNPKFIALLLVVGVFLYASFLWSNQNFHRLHLLFVLLVHLSSPFSYNNYNLISTSSADNR